MPEYAAPLAILEAGGEVVTATRRQARQLASAHTARQRAGGRSVWATPRILPWSAWLERSWRLYARDAQPRETLLDETAATRIWERIVATSPAGRGLIDARAAGRGAARTWRLACDWCIDLASVAPETAEHAAFLEWARSYQRLCGERGWVDPATLPTVLLAVAARLASAGLPAGPIGFLGFDQVAPGRHALLEALRAAGHACPELRIEVPCARVATHAAASPEVELEAIAAWLVARLRERPQARLGVVIPDLASRWAAVRGVLDDRLRPCLLAPGAVEDRPHALAVGPRLRDHAIVDTASALFALVRERVDSLRVGRLLRSPYLRGATEEAAARARLDAELRREGEREVRIEHLLELARSPACACPALAASVEGVRRELPREGRRSAASWAAALQRALAAAGWPEGRGLASSEFQSARKLHEAVATLGALAGALPPLSLGEALDELAAIVADSAFQPEAGDPPVLVLDSLSDPGLEFDGLWVAGLTAERFPAAPAPDAFLPLPLQRAHGLPHASAEWELERARGSLAAWRRSARELVLSWPLRDADGDCIPSPLLPADASPLPPAPLVPARAAVVRAAGRLVEWHDTRPPPIAATAPVAGGVRVLTLQSACPFRATAEQRLGAHGLERLRAGLDPRLRGQLAHAALAIFWRETRDRDALLALDDAARRARVAAAIESACASLNQPRAASRLLHLERRWLERAMLALLGIEAGRAPFTVVACEQDRRLRLGRHMLDVRIDRMDRLDGGDTVLVDYKTGRTGPERWTGPRPDEPQLPAYAAHLEAPPVAVAVAKLPLVAVGFDGLAARAGVLPGVRGIDEFRHEALRGRSWASLIEEWRRVTVDLLEAFAGGVADVDPAASACARCDLAALCRIEARASDGEAAEATPDQTTDEASDGE